MWSLEGFYRLVVTIYIGMEVWSWSSAKWQITTTAKLVPGALFSSNYSIVITLLQSRSRAWSVVPKSKFSPWRVFLDKFSLLMWTGKNGKFFLDKLPCSKASMLAFQQGGLSRKILPFFPVHMSEENLSSWKLARVDDAWLLKGTQAIKCSLLRINYGCSTHTETNLCLWC